MRNNLLALFVLLGLGLHAAPGDTTYVQVHQSVDMVWYERYKAKALFPAPGTDFHRVNMKFTLGCATGGCSDWDYTVLINVLHPTGEQDSSVASIDTISTNPLIIDTIWQVFDVKEPFELGRMITPYGGYMRTGSIGFDNNWTHELIYDVTDYQSILRDSVEIEIFYQGWSSGFSADLQFEMIEGTPARSVKAIRNVYPQGGFTYRNSNTVEANHLPPVNLTLDAATQYAALHILPSGHGFNNTPNCAEFCQKSYYVRIDGQTTHTQSMWRNDCGLNPVYPQAGTWLYDRANWCPGAKAWTYEHDVSSAISSGGTHEFNVDIEAYSIPSGQDPASYNWSTVLLEFDSYAHQHDAELMEIISPSMHEDHGRLNPACGRALVKIRNKGAQRLTSCTIEYGYDNATLHTFNWQGDLGMMEEEVVELGLGGPGDWQQSQFSNGFFARVVAPNGMPDEYALNDEARSMYAPTPVHSGALRLNIRTNGKGNETWWELKDHTGALLQTGDGYQNYQFINEDLNLAPGCYHLRIYDRGKNGLSFFANSDGNGYARLYEQSSASPLVNFQPNFGTRIDYWFTVGMGLGQEADIMQNEKIDVFPNPTDGVLHLLWVDGSSWCELTLRDLTGRVLDVVRLQGAGNAEYVLDGIAAGAYLVDVVTENGDMKSQRIVRR